MILLFIYSSEDEPFLSKLKSLLAGHTVKISKVIPVTVMELQLKLTRDKFDGVLTTNHELLKLLTRHTGRSQVTLDDYAGSMFHCGDVPVVVLNPLYHLVTTKTAPFLFARYISKITRPAIWFNQTKFTWEVATDETLPALYDKFNSALLIAVDIETPRGQIAPFPYCVGYCGVWLDEASGNFVTHSIVIPTLTEFDWVWVRRFNSLPAGKIMQNGSYDCAYFSRYAAVPENYLWDTQHLMHSWYSELPKRLDFLASFVLRDVRFWKDDASTGLLADAYEYNARDVWSTANACLALFRDMPKWALRNYVEEFPVVFPCTLMSLEGLAVDPTQQTIMASDQATIKIDELASLQVMVATPNFNPGSPKQKLQLLSLLGVKDAVSTDKKALTKAAEKHPIIGRIVTGILKYQRATKLLSTYINIELLNGRWLYAFNVSGTDTGRLASKRSSFWCGTQIQNAPKYAKKMVVADSGYLLGERDYSQSEARCVGYMAQDIKLIEVVESDNDYHGLNAQQFFGIPYAEIVTTTIEEYDSYTDEGVFLEHVRKACHVVINTAIRDLSKRTNHGANYNMGANVMLETMGEANVYKAKKLLKLPDWMSLKQVCQTLLDTYAKTYPRVKGAWYNEITYEVKVNKKLVSPLGWTRYFFGDPSTNKRHLNAAVAHGPQNLSVSIINRCLLKLMYFQLSQDNWSAEEGKAVFRLKAQVHDSILYQYLEDPKYAWVHDKIAKLMRLPVNVHGRRMLIPSDLKSGSICWADLK